MQAINMYVKAWQWDLISGSVTIYTLPFDLHIKRHQPQKQTGGLLLLEM